MCVKVARNLKKVKPLTRVATRKAHVRLTLSVESHHPPRQGPTYLETKECISRLPLTVAHGRSIGGWQMMVGSEIGLR